MQPYMGISHGQTVDLFTVSILIWDGKSPHDLAKAPGDVEGASRGSPANSTATLLQ